MSTGDYLRYLRALRGGLDLITVSQRSGVSTQVLREIEQRYRSVGNDATIEKLAQYYDVPADELRWRQAWSRKGLSKALAAAQQQRIPLQVNLRTGQSLRGQVVWWDLGAALLELGDGRQVVVQRHMVDTWEPRAIEVESDIDL